MSIWVFNEGMRSAENVILGLYPQLPNYDSAPRVSAKLNIPAGEYRVANLNLGTYPHGFFAGIGIGSEMGDRDASDNVLQIGNRPKFTYLPLIMR